VSSESELPPKSLATLNKLEGLKRLLRAALGTHCINDEGCHNWDGAKDYLRSYCCTIFDSLKEAYSTQISVWNFEEQIAEEAIRVTLKCWDNFNFVYPKSDAWRPTLRDTIVQHLGRPIRPPLQRVLEAPASAPAPSAPLIMHATAQTKETPLQESPSSLPEVERRANLLADYKKNVGNPSNRKIYEAPNSGIHKPEFYRWVRGTLPQNSRTTKQFEAFLKSRRKPQPKDPTREI
jgi:hypothetical protein